MTDKKNWIWNLPAFHLLVPIVMQIYWHVYTRIFHRDVACELWSSYVYLWLLQKAYAHYQPIGPVLQSVWLFNKKVDVLSFARIVTGEFMLGHIDETRISRKLRKNLIFLWRKTEYVSLPWVITQKNADTSYFTRVQTVP